MKPARVNLLPVRYPVYQAISELNNCLEQAINKLEQLADFNFFRRDYLQACQVMVEEIRALANHELIDILSQREFGNAAYYERLRLRWQNRSKDPNEILFDAKHYKRRLGKRNPKQPQPRKTR